MEVAQQLGAAGDIAALHGLFLLGNMVTQGFQTLTGKFEADKKINRVEFSVRRKVKGEKYDFQPMYSIVKTGPDWVTDADKAK